MEVFIGAHTHSSGLHADPFESTPFQIARPTAAEQYGADVAFVQRALAGEAIGRSVQYFVLGTDTWKTTPTWPPAGVRSTVMQLTRNALVARLGGERGERGYRVDPTTSSGSFTRWAAQTGAPVYYGDQQFASGRRLTFDAEPVTRDTEIGGAPELCLVMRSDQTDGVVLAYLEDVAPNGRVTYLTEGELRLLHRNTSDGGCDPAPGTARTFARADAAAVKPGGAHADRAAAAPHGRGNSQGTSPASRARWGRCWSAAAPRIQQTGRRYVPDADGGPCHLVRELRWPARLEPDRSDPSLVEGLSWSPAGCQWRAAVMRNRRGARLGS